MTSSQLDFNTARDCAVEIYNERLAFVTADGEAAGRFDAPLDTLRVGTQRTPL
jgi:hypothetical protein